MKDYALDLAIKARPGQGTNVLREYIQARILAALQSVGATGSLAFCGGTAIRFLYGVPRYSEDLDFSLEGEPSAYEPRRWLKEVERRLLREGFQVRTSFRERGAVHVGWVRCAGLLWEAGLSGQRTQNLAIKMDVDTNPPAGAVTDATKTQRHAALYLRHHDRASLFAGKLAAVLGRTYTKGRDVYDLFWYLTQRDWPAPNLALLEAALRQTGAADDPQATAEGWRQAVERRLETVDWDRVVADVRPFLEEGGAVPSRDDLFDVLRRA